MFLLPLGGPCQIWNSSNDLHRGGQCYSVCCVITLFAVWCFTCLVCIRGYMLRSSRRGAKVGDTVYLIANQWFLQWKKITGYNVCLLSICLTTCSVVLMYTCLSHKDDILRLPVPALCLGITGCSGKQLIFSKNVAVNVHVCTLNMLCTFEFHISKMFCH